jgi:ADP-heptose:LPS heptosyltransferase
MNVHTMQRIDYWFGIPLCLLFSIVDYFSKLLVGGTPANTPLKKILCVELSEMGSAILAYPMMRKALDTYPDLECHFLIFRRNVESVEMLDLLPSERIHVIEDTNLFTFTCSSISTLIKLRRLGFDAILDLELFSRCTALISFLVGATHKVGFHNYTEEGLYLGTFFTHRVWYNPHYHISQNFVALLEALRTDPTEPPLVKIAIKKEGLTLPRLTVKKEAAHALRVVQASIPGFASPKRLILFNPDPGLLALRGWPIESYRELGDRLLAEDSNLYVGIIGLERSSRYFDLIVQDSPHPDRFINLCGTMETLHDLLGLLDIASTLITNDSGPAHLAPLVGLPSVVFFGPETPNRYKPLGHTTTSLYAGLACSPCFSAQNHRRSVCQNNRCLQAISVDEALVATRAALAEGDATRAV